MTLGGAGLSGERFRRAASQEGTAPQKPRKGEVGHPRLKGKFGSSGAGIVKNEDRLNRDRKKTRFIKK